MKLSEAIRLGAMLRPQAFGVSFDGVGTCAWGAADEAMGVKVHPQMSRYPNCGTRRPEWSWTACGMVSCPVCGVPYVASSIISLHLNDFHKWTRERIADWVETIEPQETTHDASKSQYSEMSQV